MKALEDGIKADDWIDRVSVSRQLMPLLDQLQLLALQEHITMSNTWERDVKNDIAMHREMRRMLLRTMEAVAPVVISSLRAYFKDEE